MDRGLEQFIFAALILLAGVLDWVVRSIKNRSASREGRPGLPPEAAEGAAVEEDEEEPSLPEREDAAAGAPVLPTPRLPPTPVPAETLPARVAVVTVPQPAALPARARQAVTTPPARPRRANRWVNDASDARRGIVLLEVLGPCKGLEPPRRPR